MVTYSDIILLVKLQAAQIGTVLGCEQKTHTKDSTSYETVTGQTSQRALCTQDTKY